MISAHMSYADAQYTQKLLMRALSVCIRPDAYAQHKPKFTNIFSYFYMTLKSKSREKIFFIDTNK
jgi:hypothetical protein